MLMTGEGILSLVIGKLSGLLVQALASSSFLSAQNYYKRN